MPCSIVVPTHNRLPFLEKCITSLLEIAYENYEIIVVNDGSNDGTREYLDNLNNDKIKIIHNDRNMGPSCARNNGIRTAKFEIVAFTDDDCIVDKNWLKNLLAGFTDDKIGFVFGPTFYIEKNYKGYFPERLVNIIDWPGSCNIAYQKNVFEKIGGFDSFFQTYHNEDSEMAIRAVANNFSFCKKNDAIVYHQKSNWTIRALLCSAKNASVWALLKKKYPLHYKIFNPPVKFNTFVNMEDYFYILSLPILIPFLFLRYLFHRKKDIKIFFTKWPVYLFLRRYYIYKEAIKNKVLML